MSGDDLSQFSMFELFRVETENQVSLLTSGLLDLENGKNSPEQLESLMRAAHSLKGAARIVGLSAAVKAAHSMEDCFVAAQKGKITLGQKGIDLLLKGVDLLSRIGQTPESMLEPWQAETHPEVDALVNALTAYTANPQESTPEPVTNEPLAPAPAPVLSPTPAPVIVTAPVAPSAGTSTPLVSPPPPVPDPNFTSVPVPAPAPAIAEPPRAGRESSGPEPARQEAADRVLRITADNLNRLLGLAGESMVESRRLTPFSQSLLRLKRMHRALAKSLDKMRDQLLEEKAGEPLMAALAETQQHAAKCAQEVSNRLVELELFGQRSSNLSHRLYEEALQCRMRPFGDGIRGLPRMTRDLAKSLGKAARLEVIGESTEVDRDILEKLEAPLNHLIRNALDHGLEFPEDRKALGKPEEGALRLEARHSAGLLVITVTDDGRGIHLENLRQAVVKKKLTNGETAARLSEAELLEFLFLPGFTMKDAVSEISGRGVGLDVVQNMVKTVRGTIRIFNTPGKGARFQLQLPLTTSVVRSLLIEIAGEPYAVPLAYITQTLKISKNSIESLEGRQHFRFSGHQVGLVTAHQVLECAAPPVASEEWSVIVLEDRDHRYGLVVDRFIGERELVVQALDPRIGKVKNISAGALMEDGSPVLIIDVDDLLRSIDRLITEGSLSKIERQSSAQETKQRKRVLVVDDSLTVRELERKLLDSRGYEVEVAVDGMDGWNAVRTSRFNLVITDVDMPRMDGIELVTLLKKDPNLKNLPVMIVSYKDREQDRKRGLDAGADFYLTKGSFHDESLLQSVVDLIGEA